MKRRLLVLPLILLGMSAPARSGPAGGLRDAEIVQIGTIQEPILGPGDTVIVGVPLMVKPGFHVQANPASDEFLIPLDLTFEPVAGLSARSTIYPAPERHRLEGGDVDLLTYQGKILLGVPFVAADTDTGRIVAVSGSLRYQACDDARCYMPRRIPVVFRVRLLP